MLLNNLIVTDERKRKLRQISRDLPSWDLRQRQLCDLELLLNGGFSPLTGFAGRCDFDSICDSMHLADGTLWPIPIILEVDEEVAGGLAEGSLLALRDPEGTMLAVIRVQDIWRVDREATAQAVYGTLDRQHPGVRHLFEYPNSVTIGGPLEGLQLPRHYDFRHLRKTPAELRHEFHRLGWHKIAAFQTRNPMHRAHFELTLLAAREVGANLLIHPVVGMTQSGDIDHYTRVRCYQHILRRYPNNMARLSLLPLAMHMAGPREALLHAIIRQNYGCTHIIIGRDHAGPGNDSSGKPYYGPYDAQEQIRVHQKELKIGMIAFNNVVYAADRDAYYPEDQIPAGSRILNLSGTELRSRLTDGREIPTWFSFPEVADELRKSHPPRSKQGFAVFFTGLSGSGKSTIANVVMMKLLERGGRSVTLLDGDIVRKHLSSELGFSKEHRDINIRRIGFVASEITKNGGIAICAPIAPYDSVRQEVREMIKPYGGFVLVYVSTSLEVCESRDRKGLYAKARAGMIPQFTGISDPYEPPADADIVLDTINTSPEEEAQQIILHLEQEGYLDAKSL